MQLDEEKETQEPEVDDELIVLEEIVPGNSGVTVAIPSETKDRNVKKRKQTPITDYFMKKRINKNRILAQIRLFIAYRNLRDNSHLKGQFAS